MEKTLQIYWPQNYFSRAKRAEILRDKGVSKYQHRSPRDGQSGRSNKRATSVIEERKMAREGRRGMGREDKSRDSEYSYEYGSEYEYKYEYEYESGYEYEYRYRYKNEGNNMNEDQDKSGDECEFGGKVLLGWKVGEDNIVITGVLVGY
ncbi:hypothetical protein AX774_g2498 [Zancudomyces culisetae]|uniref:Uncharacterized protein n=1 Tax=Zancudomyces culisetae TaxID=1213189 RepID=A0A1R1PST5_ZANCU|nr:hypothetical protein AX774_g2498 [Zancudomyces culisetae]|eukprot:OMH83989.1 hypothetical protein AX774_g2498 [Zancudomyces culisetae]